MTRLGRIRRLSRLVRWPTVLLAAACGGGDKGPTGPGGEAPASYELVSLGRMGLPADAQVEDCIVTRFYGGSLEVTDDGNWRIRMGVHDDNYGDWDHEDEGTFEEDGSDVWFTSGYTGATYPGQVNGSEVKIMYDWCYNGVADVQLVFDQ